jgi:hypothetical protein
MPNLALMCVGFGSGGMVRTHRRRCSSAMGIAVQFSRDHYLATMTTSWKAVQHASQLSAPGEIRAYCWPTCGVRMEAGRNIVEAISAPPRPRLSLPHSRTAGEPVAKALLTILGAFGDHATSVLISVSCRTAVSQATSITPSISKCGDRPTSIHY